MGSLFVAGKVIDFSNADVAVDQYHRYNVRVLVSRTGIICIMFLWFLKQEVFLKQEDIKLMKDMGMDAYRFSIAWSRLYPSK